MKDLDSAVGRLDNILMSLYFVVAILIIAVALASLCGQLRVSVVLKKYCFLGSATSYSNYWGGNSGAWYDHASF